MLSKEQIIEELKSTIVLNDNTKVKYGRTLSRAKYFIEHELEMSETKLKEEYNRGLMEAWNIARELCNLTYDEVVEIFRYEDIEPIIKGFDPLAVKSILDSHKQEKSTEKVKKVIVGDKVKNKEGILATVLDRNMSTTSGDEDLWVVYTENGCIESWHETNFEKTGENIDIRKLL